MYNTCSSVNYGYSVELTIQLQNQHIVRKRVIKAKTIYQSDSGSVFGDETITNRRGNMNLTKVSHAK